MMTLFYRQPGMMRPQQPPQLPMPGLKLEQDTIDAEDASFSFFLCIFSAISFEVQATFPFLCEFWCILRGVCLAYYTDSASVQENMTLSFAEYKFRELLSRSNRLPEEFHYKQHPPHYVLMMQYVINSLPHITGLESVAHSDQYVVSRCYP
jgi:hypothetical protein